MNKKLIMKKAVNALTAFGGSVSAVSLYFAFQGWEHLAWILMGIGVVVDAADGSIVRLLGLADSVPRYDGARLDEYADLITYVIAPVGFAWASEMLPFDWLGVATGMTVIAVSCLQFSRVDNKTDYAFWGWPSYWNISFFYAWAVELPSIWVIVGHLILSVGVFVPIPFAYPSKLPKFRRITTVLGVVWGIVLLVYVVYPWANDLWLYLSLLYPAYYLLLSAVMYEDLQ